MYGQRHVFSACSLASRTKQEKILEYIAPSTFSLSTGTAVLFTWVQLYSVLKPSTIISISAVKTEVTSTFLKCQVFVLVNPPPQFKKSGTFYNDGADKFFRGVFYRGGFIFEKSYRHRGFASESRYRWLLIRTSSSSSASMVDITSISLSSEDDESPVSSKLLVSGIESVRGDPGFCLDHLSPSMSTFPTMYSDDITLDIISLDLSSSLSLCRLVLCKVSLFYTNI